MQSNSAADMEELSGSLQTGLRIAEDDLYQPPADLLANPSNYAQDEPEEYSAQWREFRDFMQERAATDPYPKYLYRAHVHGHPYPRFIDDGSGEYSDSFGSDYHLWVEHDAESQIYGPISQPWELLSVEGLFSELRCHLDKTTISNSLDHGNGEDQFLSSFVSLSGDFRWTAQRTCRAGRVANKDQVPGLAAFKTSKMDQAGVNFWRVQDMLSYLDLIMDSSVDIYPRLRRWTKNAEEYICWGVVPLAASVAFVPLSGLKQEDDGNHRFLSREFVSSTYLGDFRRRPLERLSLEE